LDESEVPRPACGCGKPATHQVALAVRPLELDRDAGAYSRTYWRPDFRNATHTIEAVICAECLGSKINVSVAVAATVEKKAEGKDR
jgi:hypothetical protein